VSVVANVAINVDSRGAVSKLRQVQTQSQQTERAVEGLSRAFGGLAAAFGAGFALTKVIADVKELDTNLRRLGTVGGNVAALDKGLGALSDRLDGVANKAELAAASYQALSAGFTETGTNLRVVEAATKAAVGGLVDVTSVVEVTTKTLNAYNMSGDQAAKVTDGISKAVELGQVQWSDYTSQLGRVASIAALAGVSLDELNAFVAAATKNGATAEVAFTGLSATLSQILTPAKESQEAAAKLGIQWNLAGLNAKGLSGLMDELAAAMDKDKEAAARMVGPIEAARGAFAAASKDGSDFKNILEQIGGAAGKTDADFQKMKGSLENTLKALDTSFKNLSEALGIAFGPTVVIAVQDITKAVNGFADFMAMVPQPVMNTVGTIVKLVAQILLVQKAIQGVIALKAGVTGMLAATAASATAAGTAAGGAATKVNMLKGAMLGLLKFGLVTLAIEIVVSGLGKLAEVQARMNAITKGSTKQFAEQVGGSATSRQEIENLKKQNREERARRVEEQKSVRFPLLTAQDDIARQAITQLDTRFAQLQTMGERARFATPADRARAGATSVANAMDTPLGATVGDGSSSKKRKGKSDEERAAEKAAQAEQQIQERLRGLTREIELNAQISTIKGLQFQAEMDGNKELQARLQGEERIIQIMQSTAQSLDGITDQRLQQKILAKAEGEIASANQETALEMQRIEAERTKSFDAIIADLNLELALKTATTEQERERLRIEAARAKLQADLKGQGFEQPQIDQITGLQAQVAAPLTDVQKIDQHIGKLKDEITSLTSISNIAITAAAGIGSAFATSFKGLIDGSMTAKEALGSFFKSVADMFLEMAAQIIAKQITMIILQTILKALGAVAGGGGGANLTNTQATDFGFNPSAMTGSLTPGGLFAKGGAFTNSIVSSPTMFKFADGGAMRTGLMGEAGPEAIMPLKRGADGSLGVQANGLREAMDRQQGGGSGSPVLNMSFQSTNINGVEYVSRDQLESAMAETRRNATRDGAKRGMTMTLDRIQNSSSTRRKVGI
jgi:TP901 family phage tail tape measure protein